MWFAVRTHTGNEEESKTLLLDKIDKVTDVYIPYVHKSCTRNGKVVRRYEIAIHGFVFVNLDIKDIHNKNNKRDIPAVWEQTKSFLTPNGYFFWNEKEFVDGEYKNTRKKSTAHLLTSNSDDVTPIKLFNQSYIPNNSIKVFEYFNEQSLGGNTDAFLVNESFDKMARENDIVRVISGPLTGEEGVIIQESQDASGKRKDRRLIAKFGNNLTVHYPNIRKYSMVLIREAQDGEKSKKPRLWFIIDHLIGVIQNRKEKTVKKNDKIKAKKSKESKKSIPVNIEEQENYKYQFTDAAPKMLRELVTDIDKRPSHDIEGRMKEIERFSDNYNIQLSKEDIRLILFLAITFPPASNSQFKGLLSKYIPDRKIRPFLTASSKVSAVGKLYSSTLKHKDFEELIVQVNLKDDFKEALGNDKDLHSDEESYIYDAHVALFDIANNQKKAVVSWGNFYNDYASLGDEAKKNVLDDLSKKGYNHLYSLLTSGKSDSQSNYIRTLAFDSTQGIDGFSITFDNNEDSESAIRFLIDNAAKAAVEMWQGTRLRSWRELAQQFVIIHPVKL